MLRLGTSYSAAAALQNFLLVTDRTSLARWFDWTNYKKIQDKQYKLRCKQQQNFW